LASPFTAKKSSVMPCTDIIRQGRSTLVTTIQMFKILGLTCLSAAYSMSVMYLQVCMLALPHLPGKPHSRGLCFISCQACSRVDCGHHNLAVCRLGCFSLASYLPSQLLRANDSQEFAS
jgi:hypothetical protein